MIAYNVTMNDLVQIADQIGVRLNDAAVRGKGIKFTIRPISESYRKVDPVRGNRINAVCWHGHFEFFRALFAAHPDAKIKADMITYDGVQDFNAKAWETGMKPVTEYAHNVYYGLTLADFCKCDA